MKRIIWLPLAAALAACATTYEEAADAAARAKAEYCALRPEARAALRARITDGVPVIACPADP
jgi:hypothetical protein